MATLLFTNDDYGPGGLIASTRVYDDGTAVDVVGGVAGQPRPQTATEAARVTAWQNDAVLAALAINRATMQQYLATALPQLRTLLTQATAMKAANVTSIAQAQAQVRATGAALEAVITGAIKFARLLSNTLDGTT